MDLPRDKNYPLTAVQCDDCGGHGCATCEQRGWLEAGHPRGRLCERDGCGHPLRPYQVAVYCSTNCAMRDASPEDRRQLGPELWRGHPAEED